MKTTDLPVAARGRTIASVVMANFNDGAHLADAVVQAQRLAEIEIIVSDDASTDDNSISRSHFKAT